MKILIYSRRGNSSWWRFVGSNLHCASAIEMVSELRYEFGHSLATKFYSTLNDKNSSKYAANFFTHLEICEIIVRCRLLRSIDNTLAVKMIGAMAVSIDEILARVKPDVFLTTRIDSYVLDVFQRLLLMRKIPYVGLWRAALFKDMCFITARGEQNLIRHVPKDELKKSMTAVRSDGFEATSIRGGKQKGLRSFIKKRAYYTCRDYFLNLQRHFHRDPLGYRYMTSGLFVPEYRVSFADWKAINYGQLQWRTLITDFPINKRVFVALQVNPESTIDYYVNNTEMIDCEKVLIKLITSLTSAGYIVCIKDHPNMFAMRPVRFFNSIASSGRVVIVPYDISSHELIENCGVTFTWTGTVGIQSMLKGRKTIVTNPSYFDHRAHIQVDSFSDIEKLDEKISAFDVDSITDAVSYEVIERSLQACFPGTIDFVGFNKNSKQAKAGAIALAESLDMYLPSFKKIT